MASSSSSSFLGLEGLHVFVTGAAGGIGSRAVREFLDQGCNVTAHDLRAIQTPLEDGQQHARLHTVTGDISDEESIRSCFEQARRRFGPVNILIANAGVTDESSEYPIWDLPLDLWERTYRTNIRGTFLTIKHFLRAARDAQDALGRELENLAVVVTGSETGKFGQAGHSEYASGKAGLQYGLVRGVKNEIVRLNSRARINAVAPGWVDTPMIEGRLDDPREMWAEAQATVPLRKVAKPEDVARAMAFLASHRAAGHISGECLSVDGGMEGRLIWRENEVVKTSSSPAAEETRTQQEELQMTTIPRSTPAPKRSKIRVVFTIDLDAVSGWLGTGKHPDNVLADYSSGFFAARVGVPRLLRMLEKLGIADRCTWFIPGHSAESFPEEVRQVVETGCEIGLHGYAHEGAYQMSVQQERDVLERCIEIATRLTGKKPVGYRAPLYQVRESTLDLLEEYGFEYDASLTDHDCRPFFAPRRPPIQPIDFSLPASSWMHPIPAPSPSSSDPQNDRRPLVCLPCNWYMEDMTPMQYLPHLPNSHGYVDVRVIEQLWRDRFLWIRENETGTGTSTDDEDADIDDDNGPIFPLVIHPDTSGMAHVIGMVERMLTWLRGWAGVGEVEFCQAREVARRFREREMMMMKKEEEVQ